MTARKTIAPAVSKVHAPNLRSSLARGYIRERVRRNPPEKIGRRERQRRKKTPTLAVSKDWKKVEIEFSGGPLIVRVPPDCAVLAMAKAEVLPDPAAAIRTAYERPIAGPTLAEIVRSKKKPAASLRAAITVSDITRPSLIAAAGNPGASPRNPAQARPAPEKHPHHRRTGTHRASTAAEKMAMFGRQVVSAFKILDHDCADASSMVSIGRTEAARKSGSTVYSKSRPEDRHRADRKPLHAGASGGRKAVCPGLVDLKTIHKFHSPNSWKIPKRQTSSWKATPAMKRPAACPDVAWTSPSP